MPANSKGKMVPNKTAGAKANSKTAGPNGSFPIGDKKHARLAISGATRSERAGHISPSTEVHIKAEARKVLKCGSCKKPGFGNYCQHCGGKMA
jgi:hypothetical protein